MRLPTWRAVWLIPALICFSFVRPALGQVNCLKWSSQTPPEPGGRNKHAMSYDSDRQVLVLYGGASNQNTYEWDAQRWRLVAAAGPGQRSFHRMVYDELRKVTVLFGGGSGNTTWEWNGQSWQEKLTGPGVRYNQAMTFDAHRGVTMLFGGTATGSTWFDDLWEWNGSVWIRRTVGQVPAFRDPAMAYDPERGVLVLWGRLTTGYETWEWDRNNWTRIGPGPQAGPGQMFYYPPDQRIVLVSDSIWGWNGQEWERYPYTQTPPAAWPRPGAVASWFGATGDILVYGGFFSNYHGDQPDADILWYWSTDHWEPLVSSYPWAREGHAMTYDPARRKVVIFGGYLSYYPSWNLGDTLEWDIRTGEVSHVSETGPAPRWRHALTYDTWHDKVLLFGGTSDLVATQFNDLWEWDGVQWREIDVAGPAARTGHGFAFDSKRGVAVLFGGASGLTVLGDTWEFDGQGWQLKSQTGPTPRTKVLMEFDSKRGVMVLVGGFSDVVGGTRSRQVWEWDGQGWLLASASSPGDSAQLGTMQFDATIGVMVWTDRDTWQWDGMRWAALIGAGGGAASVFDPPTGVLAHFGKPVYMMSNCAPDDDLDHVRDAEDNCEHSDIDNVLIIGRCATAIANSTFEDGCTMNDLITECAEMEAREFGFRACVRELARDWSAEGLIDQADLREIIHCTRRQRTPSRLNNETK